MRSPHFNHTPTYSKDSRAHKRKQQNKYLRGTSGVSYPYLHTETPTKHYTRDRQLSCPAWLLPPAGFTASLRPHHEAELSFATAEAEVMMSPDEFCK